MVEQCKQAKRIVMCVGACMFVSARTTLKSMSWKVFANNRRWAIFGVRFVLFFLAFHSLYWAEVFDSKQFHWMYQTKGSQQRRRKREVPTKKNGKEIKLNILPRTQINLFTFWMWRQNTLQRHILLYAQWTIYNTFLFVILVFSIFYTFVFFFFFFFYFLCVWVQNLSFHLISHCRVNTFYSDLFAFTSNRQLAKRKRVLYLNEWEREKEKKRDRKPRTQMPVRCFYSNVAQPDKKRSAWNWN